MTQKDVEKAVTALIHAMDKQLGDLKKILEKQKIAEEQERLRRIQVCGGPSWHMLFQCLIEQLIVLWYKTQFRFIIYPVIGLLLEYFWHKTWLWIILNSSRRE